MAWKGKERKVKAKINIITQQQKRARTYKNTIATIA
jgi:hypothetical protein